MPKKKTSQIITVKVEGDKTTSTSAVPVQDLPPAPLEIERVKYDNSEVLEVLNDGKETPTEFHCLMLDGRTMHVPKSLFNE